ncbi:glycogen debranching protein GlgX [Rhizobiaceae bacterium n13]|uniref:Glycogen debranching protein GlgX n=1 Tax=Ferirhizobium litorale TaxID=2927786 RepID=A0AAE3QAX2_9HYPH|nr:glycogen debranching protein GlgX [Fererhizobium litorale]MDI7860483.1 glycogen debranching protein GlgX [Fererhizobium litorale]MDI7920618.1 glycogen debranching protein GlgX [Fererhizobium litorale]
MELDQSRRGGAVLVKGGADFAIWSKHAARIDLCLFDGAGEKELCRLPMKRGADDVHRLFVEKGVAKGTRYGFRADGVYAPDYGLWYDPSKLLVDPCALEIDRPYLYDPRLTVFGENTAEIVPKAVVTQCEEASVSSPLLPAGGLIYEVAVKPFTMLHPDIPERIRGTLGALAHPAIISHLKRLHVDAVELLPITAWIDERHLPPLGLHNGWGYNPVTFMALDPRIVPGGVAELRETVEALHREGIGIILDLVFNHTGESDRYGSTLSLRGLDNRCFFRHLPDAPGTLANDTGTGNTVACDHPYVRGLILDSLRHFVRTAGIDGFRFDLATVLGRTDKGFDRESETLKALLGDDLLAGRIMIAEPWDIGAGGYQLGNFPAPFLEWNDRARDSMRRFWRGDTGTLGELATTLAGSSDVFGRDGAARTRSVNFLAAHDGFTLADLVSYENKHNEANGESNRDGHNENYSWNNGIEGPTAERAVIDARRRDIMALLSTLFATRGTIMLTAGDEGGRSQKGNNNAYCQDNEITWVDWSVLDDALIDHTASLAELRRRFAVFRETGFFTGLDGDIEWLNARGHPMSVADWQEPSTTGLAMILKTFDRDLDRSTRLAVLFNRTPAEVEFALPSAKGLAWKPAAGVRTTSPARGAVWVAPRSVGFLVESLASSSRGKNP